MDPTLTRLIEAGDAGDVVAVMVRLDPASPALPGVRVISRFADIATVRAERGRLAALRELSAVRSMKAPRMYRPELVAVSHEAVEPVDLDRRREPGIRPTGRGVLVGVLDWGIDLRHPAFLRPDGRTRLTALWDQAAGYDPSHPNPFGYGRMHDRAVIDAALAGGDPARTLGYDHTRWDVGGGTHGTATASIAVGAAWEGGVEGVAPGADLVFVNLGGTGGLGHSVAIGEAIDFVRRAAGRRPWVVNMSLGRHGGPHDGSTLLEQLLDAAVTEVPGGMVVNSTGNYYGSRVHTTARILDGGVARVPLRLEARPADVHELDVWYRGVDRMVVGIESPDGRRVLSRPDRDVTLELDGVRLARVQHRTKDPNNGACQAVVRIDAGAPAGTWHLILGALHVLDGRVHVWIERDSQSPRLQARFPRELAVTTTTTGTICNGLHNLAVGAYDSRHPERAVTAFSSSGDTVDGRHKPAILAPGEQVLVARSRPRDGGDDAPLSTRMSGTSMAAPFATGAVACLMEVAGRVPAARLRAALIRSAEAYAGDDALRAGAGYLDLRAALESLAAPTVGRPRPAVARRREGRPEEGLHDPFALSRHARRSSPRRTPRTTARRP